MTEIKYNKYYKNRKYKIYIYIKYKNYFTIHKFKRYITKKT